MADHFQAALEAANRAAYAAASAVSMEAAVVTATSPLTIFHRGVASSNGVSAAKGVSPSVGDVCLVVVAGAASRVVVASWVAPA